MTKVPTHRSRELAATAIKPLKGECEMKCNVGGADRIERIFHGVVFLLIAAFLITGGWRYILGGYGLLRLLTGIFAFCPVYAPFRYATGKEK
jgi:hypothetical protein